MFSKRLIQMLGMWLVEMVISTNHMPNIWVTHWLWEYRVDAQEGLMAEGLSQQRCSPTHCMLTPANTRRWLNVGSMLARRCRRGPKLNQHWVNVSCLLGSANTRRWLNVGSMLARRRRRGLKLNQHWVNVSCLLGSHNSETIPWNQ